MAEDAQSWKDRCDRYFSSLSENGEITQNGHVKHKEKMKAGNNKYKSDESSNIWKDLAAMRKWSEVHPVIGYIRNAVFKIDIHGSKLAGKAGHSIELLIWGIIILAVFGFTMFLVVLQYKDYQNDNTYIQIQSVSSSPSVKSSSLSLTICNQNILRKSRVIGTSFEYLVNDSIQLRQNSTQTSVMNTITSVLESNTNLFNLIQAAYQGENISTILERDIVIREVIRDSNESVVSRLRASGSTSWFPDFLTLNYTDVKEFGHQLNASIISCFIGNQECKDRASADDSFKIDSSEFCASDKVENIMGKGEIARYELVIFNFHRLTDRYLGNCYTITTDAPAEPVQLILNTETDEYISGAAPTSGFKIIIHGTGSDVRDGQLVDVGVSSLTSFHVQKETVTKRKDGECIQEPETKKKCLRDCYENTIREICGCSLSYHVSVPSCKPDIIDNLICHKAITILQSTGRLDCRCKENCRDTILDISKSIVNWPPSNYMPIVSSMLQRKQIHYTDIQIAENLAAVHVNLIPETMILQEEIEQYQILDLLARFGGLLAFVAGISVLTLVEIVWTIIRSLVDVCRYVKRRSSGIDEGEKLSDSEITSVTWAMYKQKRRQEELNKEFQLNNKREDKRKVQSSGLSGNVNSRLHRRNSYLEPISETGNSPSPTQNERLHRTPSDGKENKYSGSNGSYELKSSKYRVSNSTSDHDRYYSNSNGHIPKPYSDANANSKNGVTTISGPYSNNNYYNEHRHEHGHMPRPYVSRQPMTSQYPGRGPFDDRVHLYGNTSAYFHTNVSEPTFL